MKMRETICVRTISLASSFLVLLLDTIKKTIGELINDQSMKEVNEVFACLIGSKWRLLGYRWPVLNFICVCYEFFLRLNVNFFFSLAVFVAGINCKILTLFSSKRAKVTWSMMGEVTETICLKFTKLKSFAYVQVWKNRKETSIANIINFKSLQ